MRIGPGELLLIALFFVVPCAISLALGYFIGKGVGFKEGLREAERQKNLPSP